MEIEEDMEEIRADAAEQIEEEIGEMAEVVFDVIAEDPEEEHVAADVKEARVEEHAGEQWQEGGFEGNVAGKESGDVRGDGGVRELEGVLLSGSECELEKEDDDVREDEKNVNDGVGLVRIEIFERDEHAIVWCRLAP